MATPAVVGVHAEIRAQRLAQLDADADLVLDRQLGAQPGAAKRIIAPLAREPVYVA